MPAHRPPPNDHDTTGVLFVCLGNICRSPLAEAIFRHHATEHGVAGNLRIASCGTGDWHVGGPADPRSIAVAQRRGVAMNHTARLLDAHADARDFDLLIAMDRSNESTLISRGVPASKVRLIRTFDPAMKSAAPGELEVPDPYHGAPRDFEQVFDMLSTASLGLLAHLKGEGRL